MQFTSLLLPGVLTGNSLEEHGVGILIDLKKLTGTNAEELILSKLDGNPLFIQWMNDNKRDRTGPAASCCDGVVYCKTRKTTICLIELKGRNISSAVKQITNTYETILEGFPQMGISRNIIWKAVIISDTGTVKKTPNPLESLWKLFGFENVLFRHRKGKEDITDFILGQD